MEERGLQHNYVFTLVKFCLFLIVFCFLVEISREFLAQAKGDDSFKTHILFFSLLSAFAFYAFLADLNNLYARAQRFFFRNTFFTFLIPSFLIIFAILFFVFPKVLQFTFNKNIFLFLGGFTFAVHLIYVARQTKGHTFPAFINYLFLGSILYIIALLIFGLYLKIGFTVHLGDVLVEGFVRGALLIRDLFIQLVK